MTNNDRFPGNSIHETAIIAEGVTIGSGNIIGPYCLIGLPPEWKGKEFNEGKVLIGHNNRITGLVTIDSGAVLTIIGCNCYLLKSVHIGHDAAISNNVTIACGAKIGGHAVILNDCNIGLNAVIHQRQIIAEGCMIGMAAVVTKNLKTFAYQKYVGNPARLLGDNDSHPNYTIFMKETL